MLPAQTNPTGSEPLAAAMLMVFAIIVLISGIIALLLVIRARFRRDLPKPKKPKTANIPDAWSESGKRLKIPPGDDNPRRGPGDPPEDDDDDDGGEPTPPVPPSPAPATTQGID
ncbi:MAG TPA: hypothetical protein ENJ00_03855 [Phycisphaerales bacterium]|nr:hypothetical protein [Phycisphaerales bacterium]